MDGGLVRVKKVYITRRKNIKPMTSNNIKSFRVYLEDYQYEMHEGRYSYNIY